MRAADELDRPGREEAWGRGRRGPAASGDAAAARGAGGAREVVRRLETGLLYDAEDPHGRVRAVGAVTADGQRALLGARARELATRDWRQAVDERFLARGEAQGAPPCPLGARQEHGICHFTRREAAVPLLARGQNFPVLDEDRARFADPVLDEPFRQSRIQPL